MAKILVSGLVNVETSAKVRKFPIDYYPIDYPFFGIETHVSGVGYNIAKAATVLGDRVRLLSMVGSDFQADYIRHALAVAGVDAGAVVTALKQTPSSVVLYDETGRRQVYCDLKDIQETAYPLEPSLLQDVDLVVACNINFNRPLLRLARDMGKPIATDVHVLGDMRDGYNQEFMESARILFLSDEAVGESYADFLRDLHSLYQNEITVLGRGSKGAALCWDGHIFEIPAVQVGQTVNTVGAGDALFTAFNHYYAKGLTPPEALLYAQLFASQKICVSGGGEGFVEESRLESLYGQFAQEMKQKQRVFPLRKE